MCLAIDWKETVLLLSLFIWYLLLLRNFKSAPVQESINKEEPKRCHILVSNDSALFWCYFDWEMSEPLWSSIHSGHTGIRSLAVENMFVLTLWFVSAADIPNLRNLQVWSCSLQDNFVIFSLEGSRLSYIVTQPETLVSTCMALRTRVDLNHYYDSWNLHCCIEDLWKKSFSNFFLTYLWIATLFSITVIHFLF